MIDCDRDLSGSAQMPIISSQSAANVSKSVIEKLPNSCYFITYISVIYGPIKGKSFMSSFTLLI